MGPLFLILSVHLRFTNHYFVTIWHSDQPSPCRLHFLLKFKWTPFPSQSKGTLHVSVYHCSGSVHGFTESFGTGRFCDSRGCLRYCTRDLSTGFFLPVRRHWDKLLSLYFTPRTPKLTRRVAGGRFLPPFQAILVLLNFTSLWYA